MTIGDRIKFFRKKQSLTQNKLAELSGVHPVSIRRYETNKMMPQAPQVNKIAEALKVNNIALTGVDIPKMRFATVGDMMGVLMLLLSADILEMTNGEVSVDTVEVKLNPILASFSISELPLATINNLVVWYDNQNKCYELLSRNIKKTDAELKKFKLLKDSKEKELQFDRQDLISMFRCK